MIRHVWSVLCQTASFDSLTNSVSLLNTLESIIALGDPNPEHPVLFQAELVSLWTRKDIDKPVLGKMRVNYTDPNGVDGDHIILDVDLSKTHFHRTRLTIPGLLIISKGIYTFKIEFQDKDEGQWSLGAEIPLLVVVQQPAQT
jgi:hypothetical protein